MKIIIEGNLIDLAFVWKVGEIINNPLDYNVNREVVAAILSFNIYILNGNKVEIKTWTSNKETFKSTKEEAQRVYNNLNELRQEFINLWTNNQADIPTLNLKR